MFSIVPMEYNAQMCEHEGEWVSFCKSGECVMQVIVLNEIASGEYERPKGESVIMEGDGDESIGLDISAAVCGLSDTDVLE